MFPKSMSSLTDYWSSSSLSSSSSSSSDQTSTYDYKVTRHSYKKKENISFSFEQSLDVYTPISSSFSSSEESSKSSSSSEESSSSSFITTTTASSTEVENNNNKNNSDDNNNNSMSVKQQQQQQKEEQQEQHSPVVVLVMGSGWLGHAPWVYYVTNWWNSGGPKQICSKLGYTCISVRHSGGFIHVVPASITNCIVSAMVWCFLYVLAIQQNFMKSYNNDNDENNNNNNNNNISKHLTQIVTTIVNGDFVPPYNLWYSMVGIFVLMTILKWCHGPGANLDDMVQDVDDALNYIQSHRKELGLSSSSEEESSSSNNNQAALILGGYSSGGHVAATWYSRQSYLKASSSSSSSSSSSDNNKATKTTNAATISRTPYDDIVGLLYISGCMSLDSWIMSAVTWTVFYKPRCDIPSPIRHLPSSYSAAKKSYDDNDNNDNDGSCSSMIVKHLLVGCESETFGLPLLDATFCSKEYVARLLLKMASTSSSSSPSSSSKNFNEEDEKQRQRARYVPIPYANHWTILDSNGLVKALAIHLPWLMDSSSTSEPSLPSKHVTSSLLPSLSTSMSSSLSSSGGEDNK